MYSGGVASSDTEERWGEIVKVGYGSGHGSGYVKLGYVKLGYVKLGYEVGVCEVGYEVGYVKLGERNGVCEVG